MGISAFPVPSLDDIRERIKAVAEKSGFVPNVFVARDLHPKELEQ